jgi:hypothetical protein
VDNTPSDSKVSVSAASSLSKSIADAKDLAVNLSPGAYDVDLGNAAGSPFYFTCDSDGQFDLPVRIHTGGSPLTAFQIVVEFDSTVIAAASARAGSGWPTTFDATLNDPVTAVQIIGAGGSQIGAAVEIAVLTFDCIGTGTTALTGTVLETLTTGNALLGTDDRALASGAGVLSTDRTARRRELSIASAAVNVGAKTGVARRHRSVTPRRSLSESCGLTGDVNWDCKVSVTDLAWVMTKLAGGSLSYDDEDAQVAAMDVDANGVTDAVDASFLLYALGNKYRFIVVGGGSGGSSGLVSFSQAIPDECTLQVGVAFTYSDGTPVAADGKTVVLLEVRTPLNDAQVIRDAAPELDAAQSSADGLVVLTMTPSSSGDGSFSAALPLALPQAGLEVAVLMYTYDANGDTDTQRRFPWFGSGYGEFGKAGFAFEAVAATDYTCCVDADSDGLCTNGARAQDPCPSDPENDADGDGACAGDDACPYDAADDADSDNLCVPQDTCPLDLENDADGDAVCESDDSCRYDHDNDADSDMLCELHHCVDDPNFHSTFGPCLSYAADRHNFGHCEVDGACDACACTCAVECGRKDLCPRDAENDWDGDQLCANVDKCPHDPRDDVDSDGLCGDVDECPLDPENDADRDGVCESIPGLCLDEVGWDVGFGGCSTYARSNRGNCRADGACDGGGHCGCTCLLECEAVDGCPDDADNDVDSDAVCGNVDSCPLDPDNDADGDWICGELDKCPRDANDDADKDGLCGDVDSCSHDKENDADGDKLCGDVDSCPYDKENDADGDKLCGDSDSCPDDAGNDADGDGLCLAVDPCPADDENDADADGNCADADSCPQDAADDVDGDNSCASDDSCPFDRDDDADGDNSCADVYASSDERVMRTLEQMCVSGEMAVLLQANFALQTAYAGSLSSFSEPGGGVDLSARIHMDITGNEVDIGSTINAQLAAILSAMLDLAPGLLTLDVRLVHSAASETRRMLATTPTWHLLILVNIKFDACLNDALGYDADSDYVCFATDSCPNDTWNDLDDDGLCESGDACDYDADNDADGDGLCASAPGLCREDPTLDVGFGGCHTYAESEHNFGRCTDHGVCERCGCSCLAECADACPADPSNDADSDTICGDVDSCPLDPENDADHDGACAPADACPHDWYNDYDDDGICGDKDDCPWNTNLDERTAMVSDCAVPLP